MADSTTSSKEGVEAEKMSSTLAKHPEFVCFVLAITCTILTNFTHSLKQQKSAVYQAQPPPKHFFRSKSIVLDFPYGNLNNVGGLLEDEEVLFVMFYAPWCAKSMEVKEEFEKAARYMKNELTFVAINCWYGKGQCRQKNDFQTFPVLYMYFSRTDGFRYTDIPRAENMVRFAESLMYPLTHLTSQEDLIMFLSQRDNAVIGYFDFNTGPQPPGFQQFYFSSMRIYESDPWNSIEYGLITQAKLAHIFGMETSRTVYFCRALNHTLKFPQNSSLTMRVLTKWVLSHRTGSTVKWLSVSGVKSLQLSTELEKGPAVLAFVPDAPLLRLNHYHAMMREVVMLYRNCGGDDKWPEMVEASQYARWANLINHFNALQLCNNYQAQEPTAEASPDESRMPLKQCCLTLTLGNASRQGRCDVCLNYQADSALASKACQVLTPSSVIPSYSHERLLDYFDISRHGCSATQINYNPTEFVTFCCDTGRELSGRPAARYDRHDIANVFHQSLTDPYVVKYTASDTAHRCRKLRLQREYKWLPPIDVTDLGFGRSELEANVTELSCDTNRTLNFYTMNAAHSGPFWESLGVTANVTDDIIPSSVIIVDLKNEFQYRMKEAFSKQTFAYLIRNFTENNLSRDLRSVTAASRPCHDSQACVVDVTTDTFTSVVMDAEKDVVLLYYAPWCGFCAGFTHVFLSLAKYFHSATNITFARINADKNDLPWRYTVDAYPTVVIYPAHRKENNEVFPDHLQKTLSNLVLFVLKFATHSVKLQTSLEICSTKCMSSNLNSSLTRLQTLSSHIRKLEQKLLDTEAKINVLQSNPGEHSSDRATSLYMRSKILSLLLNRKYYQEKNTRALYNYLRTTTGKTLEKHKMLSILKRHSIYEAQFRQVLESASSYLFDVDVG